DISAQLTKPRGHLTWKNLYLLNSVLTTGIWVQVQPTALTQKNKNKKNNVIRKLSNQNGQAVISYIRLYEVVETPSRLYLVLEYAGGGDLHNRICNEGKFSDNSSKIIFAQILSAIKYMHNINIIHRDLKAENVLFASNGCVKVADFGFSTQVSNRNDALDTFCGSPPYAAPELFRDESYLGPPVDVWAMGVLLFFMVTGTMPFRAETMGKLRRCIIEGTYSVPPWMPGPCQKLIKGILKTAPAERYAVEQMMGCDWLLPVEFPWTLVPAESLSPLQSLLESESGCRRRTRTALFSLFVACLPKFDQVPDPGEVGFKDI
uniref:non-specific serine/threonine protein kinase n=1 Tax=Echeneis naucrates TaxID=173247 RepID=A0A665WQV5_ECHNA